MGRVNFHGEGNDHRSRNYGYLDGSGGFEPVQSQSRLDELSPVGEIVLWDARQVTTHCLEHSHRRMKWFHGAASGCLSRARFTVSRGGKKDDDSAFL